MEAKRMEHPRLLRWDDIPIQKMGDTILLQLVWTERATLARFEFTKGTHVPRHKHDAEQHTCLINGTMNMRLGETMFKVQPGEIVIIPPNVRHEGWFLEDSVVIDFFTPARSDWLRGEFIYSK